MKKIFAALLIFGLLFSVVSCSDNNRIDDNTTNLITNDEITDKDTSFNTFSSYISESHALIIKWEDVNASNNYTFYGVDYIEASIIVEQIVESTFSDVTEKEFDKTRVFVPSYCASIVENNTEALIFADIYPSDVIKSLSGEKNGTSNEERQVLVIAALEQTETETGSQFNDNPAFLQIFPIKEGKIEVDKYKHAGISTEGLVIEDEGYPKDKDGGELPLYVPIMQIIRYFTVFSKIQNASFENGITVDEAVNFLNTAVNWDWGK